MTVAAHRTGTSLPRAGALLAATAAAAGGVWWLCRAPLQVLTDALLGDATGAATPSFPQVLSGGCAAVLVGCAGWLCCATLLAVLGHVARGCGGACRTLDRVLDRTCPALVRALVSTALGVTVASTVAAPAPADDRHGPAATGLDGLALPDRTVGAVAPPGRSVVVRTGDSLWSIAASLAPEP